MRPRRRRAQRRRGGDRRRPPSGRRGTGRGRRHEPRDGSVRAGGHPPVVRCPPTWARAALAIDAVGCLVEGLGDRLGADAPTMRDALANIRMAFVEVKGRTAQSARTHRGKRSARTSRQRSAYRALNGSLSMTPSALAALNGAPQRRNRPPGDSTTRSPRRITPSARSRAAWPAVGRGRQAAVAAHDAPPRQLERAVRQQRAHGPGPAREAGVLGDVAVADDLALAQRHDHRRRSARPCRHGVLGTSAGPEPGGLVATELAQQLERHLGPDRDRCGCRRRSRRSGTGARCPRRHETWPSPTCSSKSMTRPVATSVDDLGDRDLEQVGGAGVLERGDHRVDPPLLEQALDGVAAAGQLGHGR